MSRADWSQLTVFLRSRSEATVTVGWSQFEAIVGGLPASAINHYPQWWHGDRPNTRAWRAAGFELEQVNLGSSVTFCRARASAAVRGAPITTSPRPSELSRPPATPALAAAANLRGLDPHQTLMVLSCSAKKTTGGTSPNPRRTSAWPPSLLLARERLAADARVDEQRLMPAWQRYTGTFYNTGRDALADAVTAGANIVILSGGYGIVEAGEAIGCYDQMLHLADWPHRVLESALAEHVRRTQPAAVVGFVSATTDYARLLRRTDWEAAVDVPVYLVTVSGIGGGAMVKVPRALGEAFTSFWASRLDKLPEHVVVEQLA